MMNRYFFSSVLVLILSSCAINRSVTQPGFDFGAVQVIGVLEPDSERYAAVADECARQLMRKGYSVQFVNRRQSESQESVDAVFRVNVAQFTPDKKMLMFLGEEHTGKDVLVLNPTVELSGRNVYVEGSPLGLRDEGSQVLVSFATVSLSGRLEDRHSKALVWSNSSSYEGLDIRTAMEGAAASLLAAFPLRP